MRTYEVLNSGSIFGILSAPRQCKGWVWAQLDDFWEKVAPNLAL